MNIMSGVPEGDPRIEDRALVEAAIGPRAAWYFDHWRVMDAKGHNRSWNWPACLLNLFWFPWRKLWGWTALVVAANLAAAAIGVIDPTLAQPSFFISIAISFVTGTYANHLYRLHVRQLIEATAHLPHDERLESLRRRGRTSTPALVIALVIAAGLVSIAILGMLAAPAA